VWGEAWEQNAHAAEVRVGELEGALRLTLLLHVGIKKEDVDRAMARMIEQWEIASGRNDCCGTLSASPTKDQTTENQTSEAGRGGVNG
jgi:hypothetical protein